MKTKETKRKEALERQAKYESLPKKQRIALCESRRGSSVKELLKINQGR